ncbi:hypothetical protein GCM10027596_22210 [Nocardioides korecus]
MPDLSVVMAAHDAASTIASAIASIQAQTYADWELLVVDDASSDDTLDIAHEAAATDARIRILTSQVNAGAGAARNRALGVSEADFVAVMDADDIALPERLAAQLEVIRQRRLVAVASQLATFGDWGGPVTAAWPTDPVVINRRQRRGSMPLPHPSCLLRREAVVAAGGYDERCRRAEDYALMLRLGTAPMACLPEVHLHYRTTRPISLAYTLDSGRDGALARRRNRRQLDVEALSPAQRTLADLRSTVTWVRRGLRERRLA